MADEMGVFETIYHCRAMRRLKPDPVPEDLLLRLIDAANQAPTGSNVQGARWIVVRDAEQRAKFAELNRKAVTAYVGPQSGRPAALPHQAADKRQRMLDAVLWQADNLQHIPALIIACYRFDEPVPQGGATRAGGSIWPAVQNLLLAARALGLGTVLATPHFFVPGAMEAILGAPSDVTIAAALPVGYPKGNFGPTKRPAAERVVSWDRF